MGRQRGYGALRETGAYRKEPLRGYADTIPLRADCGYPQNPEGILTVMGGKDVPRPMRVFSNIP
jgi:hypothetical protein